MTRQRVIQNRLPDFQLCGMKLDGEYHQRFKLIQQRLSGLPETALAPARQLARRGNLPGWLLTLEFPRHQAVLPHADDRCLRAEVYTAYVTRDCDIGLHGGRWDNSEIMEEIVPASSRWLNALMASRYSSVPAQAAGARMGGFSTSLVSCVASSTWTIICAPPKARRRLDGWVPLAPAHKRRNQAAGSLSGLQLRTALQPLCARFLAYSCR